jgi:hypothetical protein
MKIDRPLKTNWITQRFGENLPCVEKGVRPFKFVGCGSENSEKLYPALNMKGHSGIDMAGKFREPIYFPVRDMGVEWEAITQLDSAGAVQVIVRSTTPVPLEKVPEHFSGSLNMINKQYTKLGNAVYLQFWFVHLDSSVVFNKTKVKYGQLLGYNGSSGLSSGNHTHFTMKVSDTNSWWYIDGDNGYNGSIDIMPYYTGQYVLDAMVVQTTTVKGLQLQLIDAMRRVIPLMQQLLILKKQGQ